MGPLRVNIEIIGHLKRRKRDLSLKKEQKKFILILEFRILTKLVFFNLRPISPIISKNVVISKRTNK